MKPALFKTKVIDARKTVTRQDVWYQFCDDTGLQHAYRITPEEMDALKTVALLGNLKGKQDILFILRQMRGRGR